MSEHTLLMVRQPDYGLGWACSNVAGSLSCMRGMNETGVAVAPQGAETPWIEVDGPCYVGLHARLVLEQVAAGPDMVSQYEAALDVYGGKPCKSEQWSNSLSLSSFWSPWPPVP